MKITKRIVSVILALLLAFGSVSLIANAALSDIVDVTFKYYREENGEWIETTKIARGDTVKARLFISTNFDHRYIQTMFAYPSSFMTHEYTHLVQDTNNPLVYWLPMNADNKDVIDNEYFITVTDSSPLVKEQMIDDGGGEYEPYLPESFFDEYGWLNSNTEPFGTPFALDSSVWTTEYQFKVSDTAEGNGFMFIPKESLMDDDYGVAAYGFIRKSNGIASYDEAFTWNVLQPEDMTEDDMLSLDQKVVFVAGDNGTISGTKEFEGYIGDKLSAIEGFAVPNVTPNAGYKLTGWQVGTAKINEETGEEEITYSETVITDASAYVVDYDKTVLKAVYETTAAPTSTYTVNVYEMGIDGKYPDAPTSSDATKVGEVGAEATYTPDLGEAFYVDAKSTEGLKTTVTTDDTDVIDVYLARKSQTVKYVDEDGKAITNLPDATYYYGATYTTAAEIAKTGYTWAGWEAGKTVEVKPATDGEVVNYKAAYTIKTANVAYESTEINAAAAPALADIGLPASEVKNYGDTIVLPDLTDKAAGYKFVGYEVTGAAYDATTRTVTIGETEAKIVAKWNKIYTIKFYLDDANTNLYKEATYVYGETVTVPTPDQGEILGKEFIEWSYDVALEEGKMPKSDVVATMLASDYEVVFNDIYGLPLMTDEGDFIISGADATEVTADDAAAAEALVEEIKDIDGIDFTFVEWRNAADDTPVTFPLPMTGNLEIYPYCTVTVTFQIGKDATSGKVIGDTLSTYKTYTVEFSHVYDEEADFTDLGTPVIEGYTFKNWDEIGDVIETNTVIDGYFTANLYDATFFAENGDLKGAFEDGHGYKAVEDVPYNSEITFDEVPVLAGYTFAGWSEDGTTKVDKLVMNSTQGKKYYALYTKNDEKAYTVEIYLMGTDGKYPDAPTKTDVTKTATIGTQVTAAHADYPQDSWFSPAAEGNVTSATMTADGAILKLYFERAKVQITVNDETKDYFVGETIEPTIDKDEIKDGYEQDTTNPWIDENGDPVKVPYEVKENGNPTEINPNIVASAKTYKVEIYLMGTDGKYSTVPSATKTENAKTDDVVSKTHADYPQDSIFSADTEEKNITSGTVAADNSTTLKLFYKRAKVQITVNDVTKDYFVGETIDPTIDEDEIKDGYKQDETNPWIDENGDPVEDPYVVKENGNPTEINPNIVPRDDTPYNVEIYLMGTDGKYSATASKVIPEKGTTDAKITKAHSEYAQDAWFSAEEGAFNVLTQDIKADGSATFKLFYKRAQYAVTVDGTKAADVYHDATFKAPATSTAVPAGYTLTGWTDGTTDYAIGEEITITAPVALTAKYEAAKGTYKVEIYLMGTDGEYSTVPSDTKTENANTDEVVTKTHADYAQDSIFSADTEENNITTGKVAADGSTTLKLFYKRAKVQITVNDETKDYFVGETIEPTVDEDEIKDGYKQDETNPWIDENGDPVKVPYEVKEDGNPTEIKPNIVAETYDVAFMINDEVYASTKAAFGTPITSAGTPADEYIPEGHSFKGWSTDGKTVITDFGTVKVGGNTFFAVLEVNKYELSFEIDGVVVEGYPVEVEYGTAITAPAHPDKSADGLEFAGWVEAGNDTVKMPAKMPAKDVTYVATYVDGTATAEYTVEVYHMDTNGNYELSATTTLEARIGEVVTVKHGTVTGFTFSEADSVTSGKVLANGSTLLKVCYARNIYKATFDNDEYEVYFGAALPKVEPAAQVGKEFKGWTPEVPASMPAENLTFKSEWADVKYTITYYVNGETTEVEYAFGENVATPADPVVTGMIFKGWSDKIPATMPAENLIFVAEFEAAVYTVTFRKADGSVFEKKAVEFGDDITVPTTEPTLEYHTFEGWSGIPADGKMPARDIDVDPIFKAIPVMLIPKNDTCTTKIDRNGLTTADYVEGESVWYITGLQEVLKDETLLRKYIDVQGDGRIEIEYRMRDDGSSQAPWVGTGTVINVYDNNTNELVESFYIVIYGDLNGDSYITATDWAIAEDEAMYRTFWSDESDPSYKPYMVKASDFDGNGSIGPADSACVTNATLGLSIIEQVTGKVIDL